MSGGGDAPSPPSIPPPPPPPELMDVIDEVTGTKAITVIGPDGKKIRKIERLPRTPEEQKLYEEAGDLMNKAMVEIKKLSDYDPNAVVDFAPFLETMNILNTERQADIVELSKLPDFNKYVEDFKSLEKNLIQKEFTKQENQNEEYLNRRGYGNSTGAAEMKAALAGEKARTLEQSNVNATAYGEQLKGADLANRQNMFNFREQGRMGQLQRVQEEHQLKLENKAQLDARRQQAMQSQYGLFNMGAGIRGEDQNKAMQTRAPELANQIFQQQSMDSMNRYNAQVNATQANFQNQMAAYNSKGPSFGDTLMQLGGTAVGAYFGGPAGAMIGNKVGGSLGGRR